ncbi:hypothetical protein V9T40_000152 [Parthenolecanium corni]|uniref:alpha-glucosidase n=1 Tax=Parthenolecanium corni TaxID=536013 RepID=A0AAN9TFZ6_9HEMI
MVWGFLRSLNTNPEAIFGGGSRRMSQFSSRCLILCLVYLILRPDVSFFVQLSQLSSRCVNFLSRCLNFCPYISIFDSNGDGIGDINGITSKLDHFVEMGVETIWITPFFKSPMVDMGYDVADFVGIDPVFGTMEDFDQLMREMKKRDLKLILDLVINHSSDEHPWFDKSVKKIEPYTNYYVWRDPKGYEKDGTPIPPNNWLSIFEGSAWKWNENRKQFYYHKFEVQQPDLNLTHPPLKEEFRKIMKFWYDKGVSGFRLDAARDLVEDRLFRDEPLLDPNNKNTDVKFFDLDHIYTTDLQETYDLIHEFRKISDSCYNSKIEDRILIPESWADLTNMMKFYGNKTHKMTHFPFNFRLIQATSYVFPTPILLENEITSWLNAMPANGVANWVFENHDIYRTGSKFNPEFSDILLILIMTLPGVASLYYGQEIGMLNTKLRPDPILLKTIRESQFAARRPMQWDSSLNAEGCSVHLPYSLYIVYYHVGILTLTSRPIPTLPPQYPEWNRIRISHIQPSKYKVISPHQSANQFLKVGDRSGVAPLPRPAGPPTNYLQIFCNKNSTHNGISFVLRDVGSNIR